ncbi:lymphocyte antigen 6E-like [Eleutherodactylus coqui]|uniref:lymphocyte antigen 6E-like n=1 Tax=Eleutherodactylus coqui TaxID=57060 RepID=UPI003462A88A
MAAYTSLLLVIALCAATAHSLKCYTCIGELTNANCLRETECSRGESYCQTAVATATAHGQSATGISKVCTSSCTPYSDSNSIASVSVSCCTTDLCNYSGSGGGSGSASGGSGGASGGASIRSSCAAIILDLGSVLIILKSSVL